MAKRRQFMAIGVGVALTLGLTAASATFPFRPGPDPYDYTAWHITNGACTGPDAATADLPTNFDCKNDFKLTDYAAQPGDDDYDASVANNPQELFGVKGASTNRAWEITTGRPDTVIAVTDSGIRWDENRPNLVNKYFLNRGELPVPGGTSKGGSYQSYDVNDDGVFNVKDYAADSRATDFGDDGNEFLDPSDLIRTFSDGVDDDNNGYVDDISGWDFFEDDNDPNDDVDYGHGTGESEDSAGETEINIDPQCPNCMLMEMRVGDSFVADVNHFAEATIYATDNGASVIQSALGTLNNTKFAQDAIDYAYERGVLLMASEADEAAGHHNFPSALNHTLLANSVTPMTEPFAPRSYLALNGCTNFGGYSWITVASTSCSSDAIGQSSGIAGLVYSAARNAVDLGVIDPDVSGKPLSAEEAKQVFRLAADDVDFATAKPPFPPNNFATTLPDSQRYVTAPGWDQITGWGRINANTAVRMVAAGNIPPEADVDSPRWWEPLGATGEVDVIGRAAAPRAGSFTYEVRYAPGVQPPPDLTGPEEWTTVATGGGNTPQEGVLGTLDLAEVRAAIAAAPPVYNEVDDPTSPDHPEKDAFRVQVVVKDDDPDTGDAIEQRQYFSVPDQGLLPGFPRYLAADGASSPAFDDLDGDGVDELIVGDGNGYVHAFKADGSEAKGWPVRTTPLELPKDNPIFERRFSALLLGAPTVADIDDDGWAEVSVADTSGFLYVFEHDGKVRPGFPVRGKPAYSEEPGCQRGGKPACDDYTGADVRDELNTVYRSFTAMPAAGDLDQGTPGLELVAGSNDGHVYAWHADGTPVTGWPVLLRDPAKVAAVDPISHKVTYKDDANARFGRKIVSTPTLADLDGDGSIEVLSNVNEEYEEPLNASDFPDPALQAVAQLNPPGNTRVYALYGDGTAHAATPEQQATAHPDDQAYLAGWPVKVPMLVLELLPYVGEGSNAAPVVADLDGDGEAEVGTASIAGPALLLRRDGSSFFGNGPDGKYKALAISPAYDSPNIPSLGGGVFGRVGGGGVNFAMGTTGLRRLLDIVLPEQQLIAEDDVSVWETSGPTAGQFKAGFPARMNDLMFFNTPAIADVSGDGAAEVLQSSAMYDMRAYGALGQVPTGWPKFTGGWSVVTPAVGDLDGDGKLDVATLTREGNLFVWKTAGDACQTAEWPKYQHDLRNTGDYRTDGKRPGVLRDVRLEGSTLRFTTSGSDGPCGRADAFVVTVNGVAIDVAALPAAPGTATSIELGAIGPGAIVTVQTTDEAGNLSIPVRVLAAGAVAPAPANQSRGVLPTTGAQDLTGLVLLAAAVVITLVRRRAAAARD